MPSATTFFAKKLVQEQLYTAAAVLLSPREAIETGDHSELSELTGLKTFIAGFAGHIAATAAQAPSRANIDLTREIAAAAKALKIAVHDNLVIGRGGHASFKSLGLL